MTHYERIRALREDSDLTQTCIAEKLYIGQTTYSDYECGKIRIPVEILQHLARYYNVSMDYISGASNRKGHYPKE